jgi:hypothetical protein
MSLGLAMASGAMGQQAQEQHNKSIMLVYGVIGGMFGLGTLAYAGNKLYESLYSEEIKKKNQKYVQQAGRRTRRT